jgi:hypothetical protein
MKKQLIIIILIMISSISFSQIVYEHTSNKAIYNFIDEMANLKIIQINSTIKPYSREFIYQKLNEVAVYNDENPNKLSKRQKADIKFYLQAYMTEAPYLMSVNKKFDLFKKKERIATSLNPTGFFYKDSLTTVALQPILGYQYSTNKNGTLTHSWGGASMFGYVGKNFGFYTNVRDNNESLIMIDPEFLTRQQGVPYKNFGDEGIDYTEARGGLTYSWDWGSVGLIKDHIQWGEGYNGTNIQSGHAPSFAQITFKLNPVKWFDFNYYHGFLSSDVVDSANSYWINGKYRISYYNKYMASNMFTFFPFKGFNFSIGNSIIYTNESGGGPKAAFLIPFLFYKSVDITLSSYEKYGYASNNNHLFFSISSRNIKHLHLYFSLFADDVSVRYFFDPDTYNSFSYKLGFRVSDFMLRNTRLTVEYTRTNPYVYQHHTRTQDYTSNSYNMGHYLRDNADEIFIEIGYIPIRGLDVNLSYLLSRHGDDYDINDPDADVHSDPFMQNIIWKEQMIQLNATYQFVANSYLYLTFQNKNITGNQTSIEKFTPEFYYGNTSTFVVGVCVGF